MLQGCKVFSKKKTLTVADSSYLEELYYNAEIAYQAGNQAEARKGFAEYAKKSPKPAAGYYRLSCIELTSGNPNGAISYILKAIDKEPTNNSYYLKHVEILAGMKLYAEAGDKLYALTSVAPRYYSYYRDAIYYKKLAGDYKKAIEITQAWEKQFGFVEEIAFSEIDLYKRNKQNDDAIATYKRLIAKYPERHQYQKYLADFYRFSGNIAEAEKIDREQLLWSNPAIIKIENCKTLIQKGEYSNWLPLAREVMADHSLSFVNQRQSLPDLELSSLTSPFLDSAIAFYQTLTKKYPGEVSVARELTAYYIKRDMDKEALPLLKNEVTNSPSDLLAWQNYLNCLYRLKMGDEMLRMADSLYQVFPVVSETFLLMLKADILSENYEKGLEDAETGMSYTTTPEDKSLLQCLMAQCLAYSGKTTEAKIVVNTILQENPLNAEAMETLAKIESLDFNYPDARKWISSAITQTPASFEFRLVQLELLVKSGKGEDALIAGKTLTEQHPNSARLAELYGDAAFVSGNKTKALELWQKALQLGLQSNQLKTKIQNKSL